MGPKITVDSSTLMNKGLEVIEAHLLFGAGYDQIDVVVHPQSIVHSMVELTDGATIAQLSMPDMRLPIGYALSYPGRMTSAFGALDWATVGRLDFEVPDPVAFRCLPLAYEAGRQGGTAPACLNGANEVAVDGFLNGRLRWVDIPSVIEGVMARFVASEPRDLDDVLAADAEGRALATEGVGRAMAGHTVPALPCPPGTARG
jgi:1-deoxy-D-xylulose-5-phosphate reductoisomerase